MTNQRPTAAYFLLAAACCQSVVAQELLTPQAEDEKKPAVVAPLEAAAEVDARESSPSILVEQNNTRTTIALIKVRDQLISVL